MRRLEKEIEAEREELERILADPPGAQERLRALAKQIGASIGSPYHDHGMANTAQLTYGIHQALQTKSTVAALRISRGYLVVSVLAAAAAIVSALAAWAAVLMDVAAPVTTQPVAG